MLWSYYSTVLFFRLSLSLALPSGSPRLQETYDYIIIGGGTAGLTVASRLSENPHLQVAVVEAGGYYESDSGNQSIVPGYASYGANPDPTTANDTPLIDWGFVTAPMAGLGGRTVHYARGKTLGGTSARNYMVYHRGSAGAYNRWAEIVGDDSYTFANLLPFFRKSVHYSLPNMALRAANASVPAPSTEAYSTLAGPLGVSHANWALPMSSYASAAFSSIGLPVAQDFSSGVLNGAQYCPLTVSAPNEERSSSQASFLQAATGRLNLKIYTHTLAKKILFDGAKRATGVLVQAESGTFQLEARREIVLSAGAFQSPQLLMVSGIGPKTTLEKFKIPILVARESVGQNMWDQVSISLFQQIDLESQSGLSDPSLAAAAAEKYIANRTGILTSNGADFIGWEKLPPASRAKLSATALADLASFPADWPENEMVIAGLAIPGASGANYGIIDADLGAPLSRGNVTIISANTADLPVVNPNYLGSTTDQEVAVQIFRRCRALLQSPAFASILVGEELFPGPMVQTDEEILAALKEGVGPTYHASCTCAMGKASDPASVVDSKAKVIGVHRLRVVDASAFPLLPPGHPQATVYALAEKIAADILCDVEGVVCKY
ncbi:MAG: hypothetical protein MMC33_005081 [Icmadophila ericetorum]|nr:hypothetical protein [Icmadophila ericetorum]